MHKKIDLDVWIEKIGQEIWSKVDNVEYYKNKLINISNPITEEIFIHYNDIIYKQFYNINFINNIIADNTLHKYIAKIIIAYYKKNDILKQIIWNVNNIFIIFLNGDWKIDEDNKIIDNLILSILHTIITKIYSNYNINIDIPSYVKIYITKAIKKNNLLNKVKLQIKSFFDITKTNI